MDKSAHQKRKFRGNLRQYKRHFCKLVRMYSILPRLQNNAFKKARKQLNFTTMKQTNKQSQVVEFNEVANTPFYIGKVETTETNEETKEETTTEHYRIFIGNQAVSEPMETEKKCHDMIKRKPWALICAVAIITSQKVQKNEIK